MSIDVNTEVARANTTHLYRAFALVEKRGGGYAAYIGVEQIADILEEFGHPSAADRLRLKACQAMLEASKQVAS